MIMRNVSVFLMALATGAAAQDLASLAGGILEQSRLARDAVAIQDKAAAMDHINHALAAVQEIQMQTAGQPAPLLVNVYTEWDATSTYRPVKRKNSDEVSADRWKKDTSVRDVEGEQAVGKLDISSASVDLTTAKTALAAEDWTGAGNALDAVQSRVVRQEYQGSLPLLKAQQNLSLARSRIAEGKFKDAVAPLRAAAQGLAQYETLSPDHAAAAETMREQIDAYANDIRHNHADAFQRIDLWASRVNQWQSGKA
jgi:hypothetical protein